MKKLTLGLSVFALAAVVALPALGFYRPSYSSRDEVRIESENRAMIYNDVDSDANTGKNDTNYNRGEGEIRTGNAYADAYAETKANENYTEVRCSYCLRGVDEMKIESENSAMVYNDVDADANTGYNDANKNGSTYRTKCYSYRPSRSGDGEIMTGDATAYSTAMTMVNSNVTVVD